MSTQFTNRQWRLPNNENKDKQSNYSMDFDGSQYVDTGFNGLNNASQITISFWLNTSNLSQNAHFLGNRASNNGLSSQFFTDGNTYIHLNSQSFSFNSSTYFSNNTWHNFVIVFDGSLTATNRLKAYVDNTLITFGSVSSTNLLSSASGLFIGYSSSGGYFNGKLDGVSIFNYALSSSQVTTLYGSSSTGIGNPMSLSPKPVFYAPLGDQDAFNGANYLVPNSSLKDYVFDFENSSNQYISGTASLPNSDYTISAWINLETVTTEAIVSWGEDAVGERRALVVWNGGSGDYKLYSSTYGSNIAASTTLVTGQWYHVAVTVSSAGVAKIYLNGSQDGTGTNTLNAFTSTDFYIGRTPSGEYFDGRISNAQIFNSTLPATGSNSVETLYNNGSPLTSMSGFTSLQGWWKLDASATYDSSTTTWTIPDDSSNSNDGTSSGMTQANLVQSDLSFTSGYSPYALDFDGTNDYITVSNSTAYSSYSVSCWINADTLTNFTRLVSLDSSNHRFLGLHGDGTLISGYKSGSWSEFFTTSTITIGTWNHIVLVDNGTNTKIYVNNTVNTLSNSIAVDGPNYYIGTYNGSGNFFDGKLSNISIWNAALTSSQVTEIYNEGVPSNLNNHSAYSNLVSWWQLGSNSSFNTNWTVLDEVTASGNNGTSVNMGEDAIVDGVGSYANGLSSGMGGDEVIGDAPYSTANSLSVNMDVLDRVEDTPA